MRKNILLTILFLLNMFLINAQEIKVYGKVIDKITKEAIPYATVVFNKNSLVADKMGNFSIQSNSNKNYLKITAVGYEPYILNNITNFLLVELQRVSNNLPEAVVYTGGESILEKAYQRIPENYYFNDSAAVLGIQQSFLLLNDSDYLQVDTALLCYSVTDENNKLICRTNLLSNQVSKTKNIDSLQFQKLKIRLYNMYTVINRQLIYEPKSYKKIFKKKPILKLSQNKKEYSLVDKIMLNNRITYVIEANFKDTTKHSKVYFIDSISLAFVKIISQYQPNGFERLLEYPYTTFIRGEINYRLTNVRKWVLNNIRLENFFYFKFKNSSAKAGIDFVNIDNPLGLNLDSLLKHNNQYDYLRKGMDFLDINSTQTISLPKDFLKNIMDDPAYQVYFTTPPIVIPKPKNSIQDFSNPIKPK